MTEFALRDKIMGCWIGKSLGGTLGMPFEGCAGPLQVSWSDLSLTMLPNDDLDLQLLWVHVLEQHGLATRAVHLAQAAADHYVCYPDEYGVARWNTWRGYLPPVTGRHNNWFGDGMGAAIRTEIWACIAPGRPGLAAALAREDAMTDHYDNGVWAAMFLAALESQLFVENDLRAAMDCALSFIPRDCRLATALRSVIGWHSQGRSWDACYDQLERAFGSHNFTDVTMNLSFIAMGLLYGDDIMESSVRLAINGGMDTDCTGATCGAIMGIRSGASGLPEALRQKAGDTIAFSPGLGHLPLPHTLDDLTRRVMALGKAWASVDAEPLHQATPDKADEPADPRDWLVFHVPVAQSPEGEPSAVREAEADPATAKNHMRTFQGIVMNLEDHVKQPGDVLYLLTWICVDGPGITKLMACADAGLTVWLDGCEVINYHGRRKALPAFHRTEGGATVPVSLTEGRRYRVKIRLLTGAGPLTCVLALGDDLGRHALHSVYGIPGISRGVKR